MGYILCEREIYVYLHNGDGLDMIVKRWSYIGCGETVGKVWVIACA